ncbi:MAG: hypothetical protein HYX87_07270 [Chloroflexi bacterium]|nr:hypothetical protein [Chloroflexota bacterium]
MGYSVRLRVVIVASALVATGILAYGATRFLPRVVADTSAGARSNPLASASSLGNQDDPLVRPVAAFDSQSPYLTVNVDVTDTGVQPPAIYLPAGKSVLLVMRNRGTREHHYHIFGLVPADILWLSKESDGSGAGAGDHDEHNHGGALVPYHICSSGVCPTGDDVHMHAVAGDMDAILFTATTSGTFLAQDPLHPEINGKVVVY